MTAEAFIETQFIETELIDTIGDLGDLVQLLMIEFAKFHCEQQLKAIEENVRMKKRERYPVTPNCEIDKDSIHNAYDLSNIK